MVKFNFGLGGHKSDDNGQDPTQTVDPSANTQDQDTAVAVEPTITLDASTPAEQPEAEAAPIFSFGSDEVAATEPVAEAVAPVPAEEVVTVEEPSALVEPIVAEEPIAEMPTFEPLAEPVAKETTLVDDTDTFTPNIEPAPVATDTDAETSFMPSFTAEEAPVAEPVAETPVEPIKEEVNFVPDFGTTEALSNFATDDGAIIQDDTPANDILASTTPASTSTDPVNTLAQVKTEIQNFVNDKENTITGYQGDIRVLEAQIKALKADIKDEEKAIKDKKAEFAKMLDEIQALTGEFEAKKSPKKTK